MKPNCNYQHFLLTRFNVKNREWNTTKYGEDVSSEKWLSERFILFEKFCLPSVLNQVNSNFKWLIFFDISTPELYKNKASSFAMKYEFIHIYFIDDMDEFLGAIKNSIKSLTSPNLSYLITSRIDNDDAIHRDYIKLIQRNFIEADNLLLDLRYGWQLNLENKHAEFREHYNEFNPFLTLIEKYSDDVNTVFFRWHRHWRGEAPVSQAIKNRLWVEIVHSSNQLNSSNFKQIKKISYPAEALGLSNANICLQPKILIYRDNFFIIFTRAKNFFQLKFSKLLPVKLKERIKKFRQ